MLVLLRLTSSNMVIIIDPPLFPCFCVWLYPNLFQPYSGYFSSHSRRWLNWKNSIKILNENFFSLKTSEFLRFWGAIKLSRKYYKPYPETQYWISSKYKSDKKILIQVVLNKSIPLTAACKTESVQQQQVITSNLSQLRINVLGIDGSTSGSADRQKENTTSYKAFAQPVAQIRMPNIVLYSRNNTLQSLDTCQRIKHNKT